MLTVCVVTVDSDLAKHSPNAPMVVVVICVVVVPSSSVTASIPAVARSAVTPEAENVFCRAPLLSEPEMV
jgi:hypothetical protein